MSSKLSYSGITLLGLTAALGLAVALAPVRAEEAATYDLRGPGPKKGEKWKAVEKLTLKDAQGTFDDGSNKVTVDMNLSSATEQEREVLAVTDKEVTKARIKVVKRQTKTSVQVNGMDMDNSQTSPLEGETVVLEKVGKEWKRSLAEGKPTDEQTREINDMDVPTFDAAMYPEKKVAKGHKWDIDAATLKRIAGPNASNIKGKAKGFFRAVEKVDGVDCAVVDIEADLKADTRMGGQKGQIEMKGLTTIYRALATGRDVKSKFTGTMRLKFKVNQAGQEVESEIKGKTTVEATRSDVK